MIETTNWDAYYQKNSGFTPITRTITCKKILAILREHYKRTVLSICELGGANSCIAPYLVDHLGIDTYHIIDNNAIGLRHLENFDLDTKLTWEHADVFDHKPTTVFDCVISIGLIEHFDVENTRKAIEAHFSYCKPGGLVLLTFPTPTLLYRSIRKGAEMVGRWSFPDERPLRFDEVLKTAKRHGDILHQSINWKIGLTQGILLVRRHAND